MVLLDDVRRVQRAYPRLFLACHVHHVRARSTEHALSDHDASILSHLDPKRPTSPGDLARHMAVGLPAMSATLDRLEELGYVERKRSTRDRRAVEVRLTKQGDKAMAATSVLDAALLEQVLAALTPTERKRAIAGLELFAVAVARTQESKKEKKR